MSDERITENTFIGSDADTAKGLAEMFPGLTLTKTCNCIDAGIICRNTSRIHDEMFCYPESMLILCNRCKTPYAAETGRGNESCVEATKTMSDENIVDKFLEMANIPDEYLDQDAVADARAWVKSAVSDSDETPCYVTFHAAVDASDDLVVDDLLKLNYPTMHGLLTIARIGQPSEWQGVICREINLGPFCLLSANRLTTANR